MTDETRNPVHPRRSVLFVPADKPRAIARAGSLGADTLILDLEDAVADDAKASARCGVPEALSGWASGRKPERTLRISAVGTRFFADDVALAAHAGPDAVVVPKVDTAEALMLARQALDTAGFTGPLWAMIETPRAILNLRRIGEAARGARLSCLVAGTNDMAAALRCRITDARRAPLLPALAEIVLAARAYGLTALDGVYNAFADADGFAVQAAQARDMGFDGKTLIHPVQVDPANAAFSPSAAELSWARAVVSAFSDPANAGKGALAVGGEMVELMHLDAALAMLAVETKSENGDRE